MAQTSVLVIKTGVDHRLHVGGCWNIQIGEHQSSIKKAECHQLPLVHFQMLNIRVGQIPNKPRHVSPFCVGEPPKNIYIFCTN